MAVGLPLWHLSVGLVLGAVGLQTVYIWALSEKARSLASPGSQGSTGGVIRDKIRT